MKPILALLLTMLLTIIIGVYAIPILREHKKRLLRKNKGKRLVTDMDTIPDMGGIIPAISIFAIAVSTGLLSFVTTGYPDSLELYAIVFAIIFAFTLLGAYFDKIRLTGKERNFKIGVKSILTIVLSGASLYLLIYITNLKPELRLFDGSVITIKRSVKLIIDILAFSFILNALGNTKTVQGLTTSLGILISVLLAGLSLRLIGTTNGLALSIITGGLIGFILFNWPNAKAKIGNIGTHLIGASIAITMIFLNLELFIPLLLIMPILDTIFKLKPKKIKKDGKIIYKRSKLSDKLTEKGWAVEAVNIIYMAVTLIACLITYHVL